VPKSTFLNLPAAKRKLITDLALDEFAAHSFQRASLSRIVARARIAKGSMYQYFEDKFDLYIYVLELAEARKAELLREALGAAGTPGASTEPPDFLDLVRMEVEVGMRLVQEEPRYLSISNMLTLETDRAFQEKIEARLAVTGATEPAAVVTASSAAPTPAIRYILSVIKRQLAQDVATRRGMTAAEFMQLLDDALSFLRGAVLAAGSQAAPAATAPIAAASVIPAPAPAMPYRTIGQLKVSRLGFGCYGMSGAYGRKDPAIWAGLVRAAFDAGVTLFDTADGYGQAEEILGRAVAPFRRDVVIATKVGMTAALGRDLSASRVLAACDDSLRRLGTDWIDLYQVHFDDPATPVADTIAALESLKSLGKIREYGVGHLPLPRVREYAAAGRPAALLAELSPVARRATRDLLPFARERDVAVIAFSPTGRGLLTGAVGAGHQFEPGDIRTGDALFQREKLTWGLRVRDHLAGIGHPLGKTPAQMAIAWVLAQPGVVAALTGPSREDHLRENLGAVAAGWELPAETEVAISAFLAREDQRVNADALATAHGILARPLPRDGDAPYRDLLYALETLVELDVATEKDVMPLALSMLATRRRTGGAYDPALEGLRERAAELAGVTPGEPSGTA
jgi:aryl-alcohol dehydrogenase-like predicted oxidoreductase/AcrR family transcriptional regulator